MLSAVPFPSPRKSFSYLLLVDVNAKNSIFFHVEEVYWDDRDKGQARQGEEKKKREKEKRGEKKRREKKKREKEPVFFNMVCFFFNWRKGM